MSERAGATTLPAPLPRPAATRLRRPRWRDWRLVVGLVLVLASAALGARLVATAARTTGVYAAAEVLATGEPVSPDDLRVVQVRLQDAAGAYLRADRPLPGDAVVLRTVGAGELVPLGAVGSQASLERKPVTVQVQGAPSGLAEGGQVDVWVARPDPDRAGSFLEPEQLAAGAEVFSVDVPEGSLTITGGTAVQVLLAEPELPQLLDVLANDGAVSLVPVPGTAPPGSGS